MIPCIRTSLLHNWTCWFYGLLWAFQLGIAPHAAHAAPVPGTVQALFVSDIHFEPFWDPAKVTKLNAAPVTGWKKILDASDSPNRQGSFDQLQSTCHTRGTDTSYAVLQSSFRAMRSHAAGVKLITLSGDLIAHGFDCKYKTLVPKATAAEYRAFTVKTIRFVLSQLQASVPDVPLFTALGNNDSDCGDYRLDAHSAFLEAVGRTVTGRFPVKERANALASFSAEGNYSVMLPAAIENTRLIVLDDVFFSTKHTSCSGKPDTADQNSQYAWLGQQLAAARKANSKVWLMAHIPPGVDAYATLAHLTGPCGHAPKMLLSSDRLSEQLSASADVVRLAIFGHTHEDEIKLLGPESDHGTGPDGIPVKLVASISPINGNLPSFTIAQIDPATATLVDYQVIAGSDKVAWRQQYDFRAAYNEKSFSSVGLQDLLTKFAADRDSRMQLSQSYIHNFSIGNPIPLLSLVWPGYVCTMAHQTASGFSGCACGSRQAGAH